MTQRRKSFRRSPGWRIALLVCAGLVACSTPEERAQVRLERGIAAQERGAHDEAVIEFRGALQGEPNRAETHYRLALSLLETRQFRPGIWELREAIRLDPENLAARLRLAWIAVATHDPDEALEQAKALRAADPASVEGRVVTIAAYLQKGSLELATTECEEILARWPEEKRAHYNLAQIRSRQGRFAEAEASLLRYRELDGGSANATLELARFYVAAAHGERAESLLRESMASAAPADRPDLALELATILERRDQAEGAEAALRQALAGAPERTDVQERLVAVLVRGRRFDDALAIVAEAKQRAPKSAEPYRMEANILADAGRVEEALASLRAGLALDPTSRELRLSEVDAMLLLADVEGASEKIRSLLADHPGEASVALAHARVLARAARSDEAIEVLESIVAREPKSAHAQFLLGALRLGQGHAGDAVSPLQVAADRMPAALEPRRLLAEARLKAGDFEGAAAEARRVLEADPRDTRTRVILAEALLGAGSAQEAEAVLRAAGSESHELHAALARVLVRQGRLADAQAEVEQALAQEPGSVQRTVDLVWILIKRGQGDAALELVEAGILEHPSVADYPYLKGQILLRLGNEAGAERALRRALELDPTLVPAYLNLAQNALRGGRIDAARELLQRALAQKPSDSDTLRTLGELELRAGRPDQAIAAFEAALLADSGSALSKSALARALAETGRDLDRALELARSARESDLTNADFAEALGRVLHRKGLYAAAVDQFRAAIELLPHPIAAYRYRLGLALLADGDRKAAARELAAALAIDPSFDGAAEAKRLLGGPEKTKPGA